MGKTARTIRDPKDRGVALRDETLVYSRAAGFGEHVHVRAFCDGDGVVFQVIRSHHVRKPLAVVRGTAGRARIEYRPVHADILKYDSLLGRLRIAARAASVVPFYRKALGRVLFNDEQFFEGDGVCSLRAIQDKGATAFDAHGIPGIGRAWITECVWERGDQALVHVRSRDCLRSLNEMGIPLYEGRLIQAKIKFQVVERSTRPVTITVRVPSRIEVTPKRHEVLADRFLDAVGIRSPQRAPSEDLWSLHPWRHAADVWRLVFGSETDALVRAGALVPTQLASVEAPEQPSAGRVLEAHPVPEGGWYGVSRSPEVPSRSLTATHLDGLELKPDRLQDYLRSSFGITDAVTAWDGGAILDLGSLPVGDKRIRFALAVRAPGSGMGDRLRANAGGAYPVLLVPSSRLGSSELATIGLRFPISTSQLITDAVAACGIGSSVPARFSAPYGTRLVVDTRSGDVSMTCTFRV